MSDTAAKPVHYRVTKRLSIAPGASPVLVHLECGCRLEFKASEAPKASTRYLACRGGHTFALTCMYCDDGSQYASPAAARRDGWTGLSHDPEGCSWTWVGYCSICGD